MLLDLELSFEDKSLSQVTELICNTFFKRQKPIISTRQIFYASKPISILNWDVTLSIYLFLFALGSMQTNACSTIQLMNK